MKERKNLKIKKERIISKKAGASYLQILMLILASFAFSYIIYQSSSEIDSGIEKIKEIEKDKPSILEIIALLILKRIREPILPLVSAAGEVCCERTSSGALCQNAPQQECNSSSRIAPTKCENTAFCKPGCCFNPNEGTCSLNSPESNCKDKGGVWYDDKLCNIQQCKNGCCTYGSQASWTTERECQKIGEMFGADEKWDSGVSSEVQCLFLAETQDVGACVYEQDFENMCKFTTKAECLSFSGNVSFHKNYLCTAPSLNTICKKTQETTCVEGKDEVYFKDSCGNPANIYDSSKVNDGEYWKFKKTKEESCNYGTNNGNANSASCGNCKYVDGGICGLYRLGKDTKPEIGNYVCRDLSCKDVEIDGKKTTKQNGESWCVFDGAIGVGEITGKNLVARDVPGSRHWRHVCIDGEERVEPCEDYRNQVCVEQKDESSGRTYSQCRINRWQECLDKNMGEFKPEDCTKNPDCWVKHIAIDKFKFDMCVPKYPEGFELVGSKFDSANVEGSDSQNICGAATQTCTVIYIKTLSGCKCKVNCACRTAIFTQQMNSLCVSLGDCGGSANIAGVFTHEGYNVKNGVQKVPQSDIEKYISFANSLLWPGQRVEPGNLTDLPSYLGALGAKIKEPKAKTGWSFNIAVAVVTILLVLEIIFFTYPFSIPVIIVYIILMYLFGIGKVCKKVKVTYTCKQWVPPVGGKNCEKCNNDILKPCTKYRCQSLGQACEIVNEGTDQEMCVDLNPNDATSPKISPLLGNISEGYSYENIQANGFEIKNLNQNDGCIEAFTPLTFGIKTDELARCKFDFEHKENFEEMEEDFGSNLLLINHTMIMLMPSPESLADYFEVPTSYILEKYGNLVIYVRCQDAHGNFNQAEYSIKMCLKQGPDKTPPYITSILPENGKYVKYGTTEQQVSLWTNEPAECRYDNKDTAFDSMTGTMNCAIYLEDYDDRRGSWPCNFTLQNITSEKKIFIRCKDQPWLAGENESQRNAMQQSYEYILKVSTSELKIDEITPKGEIEAGVEPVSVTLQARTSGGAESGKARCQWEDRNNGWSDYFIETDSSLHRSSPLPLVRGSYKIYVRCEDIAGNSAESFTEFTIDIDTSPPGITRVYYDGNLKIMTDEEATCGYSLTDTRCNFDIENSTIMSGNGREHSTDWQIERNYYIKCKDGYGNKPGGCSIVVRPYNLV